MTTRQGLTQHPSAGRSRTRTVTTLLRAVASRADSSMCPESRDVRSAVVAAETERVAGRVEQNPDVVLRLVRGDRRAESYRVLDRRLEVTDLEVEMHHRTLLPVNGRPHRWRVSDRLLKHDEDRSLRRDQN